jgi:hypothetical protein
VKGRSGQQFFWPLKHYDYRIVLWRWAPFYTRLNELLEQEKFDEFAEAECAWFYAEMGRPSLTPGTYFGLLLIG